MTRSVLWDIHVLPCFSRPPWTLHSNVEHRDEIRILFEQIYFDPLHDGADRGCHTSNTAPDNRNLRPLVASAASF